MTGIEPPIKMDIPPTLENERLDKALAIMLPEVTRAAIQQWIKMGNVLVNETVQKPKHKVQIDDLISITVPPPTAIEDQPQMIPLDIIYEDNDVLIINKPAGLVVHPGAGNSDHTLLNGLLYHCHDLRQLPRAGIVHRLDKGTSGLMAVAKTEVARNSLIAQLSSRTMQRKYLAIIEGTMISGSTVEQPIGRHFNDRLKMAVSAQGKPATTHFRVKEKYTCHTLVHASLETGRTHQIRVHLSWLGYPIVGDRLYGFKGKISNIRDTALIEQIQRFGRPALHAQQLSLIHPQTNESLDWQQSPPEDFVNLQQQLLQASE